MEKEGEKKIADKNSWYQSCTKILDILLSIVRLEHIELLQNCESTEEASKEGEKCQIQIFPYDSTLSTCVLLSTIKLIRYINA